MDDFEARGQRIEDRIWLLQPLDNLRTVSRLQHHRLGASIPFLGNPLFFQFSEGTLTFTRPGSSGRYSSRRGSTASSIHSIGGSLDTASHSNSLTESSQNGALPALIFFSVANSA